jgi:hypothetical protein
LRLSLPYVVIPTKPFAWPDDEAVFFPGQPFHAGPGAIGRGDGFADSVTFELDALLCCRALKSPWAVEIVDGELVPALTAFDPQECPFGTLPLS